MVVYRVFRTLPADHALEIPLRHSQIVVTMDVYSEASSKVTRRALRRLDKSLDG